MMKKKKKVFHFGWLERFPEVAPQWRPMSRSPHLAPLSNDLRAGYVDFVG